MNVKPSYLTDPGLIALRSLTYAGLRLRVIDGDLAATGPTKPTPDHVAMIERHYDRIMAILQTLPQDCVHPHLCHDLGGCVCRGPQDSRKDQAA